MAPDVRSSTRPASSIGFPLRCLWISRDIPFPQDAGDRIYSANMAGALASAGVEVRFLGYGSSATQDWPAQLPIIVNALPGERRGKFRALFSTLPIAAAVHATRDYRELLDELLKEAWDMIVIDSYGSGWALDACLAAKKRAVQVGHNAPALVYLSHNHEESIWHSMATQSRASLPQRIALWQNYRKVRALERRLVAKVDLISAITEEDAQTYVRQVPGKATITLTPGYSGWVSPPRNIDIQTPRHVVLVGSFRWVMKQENLRRFLELADARFQANGIVFDVIGDVPASLLDELRPKVQAARFHGFVDHVAPYFANARMAVVPELIGGGFKLKYLDYLFGRVPIATITEAAAGLPAAVRDNMLARDDLTQLVGAIIDHIDSAEKLNLMQSQAFAAAEALFDWKDRGLALRKAVENRQVAAAASTHPSSWRSSVPRSLSATRESRT